MITGGPTTHLSWEELRCHDRERTPYPKQWRKDRAVTLGLCFEQIRAFLGDWPLHILSAYRTPAYNMTLEGAAAKSQHIEGRALDILHPRLTSRQVHDVILHAQEIGSLPTLGGLGIYASFVHVDVRPKPADGHLARWSGKGVAP